MKSVSLYPQPNRIHSLHHSRQQSLTFSSNCSFSDSVHFCFLPWISSYYAWQSFWPYWHQYWLVFVNRRPLSTHFDQSPQFSQALTSNHCRFYGAVNVARSLFGKRSHAIPLSLTWGHQWLPWLERLSAWDAHNYHRLGNHKSLYYSYLNHINYHLVD